MNYYQPNGRCKYVTVTQVFCSHERFFPSDLISSEPRIHPVGEIRCIENLTDCTDAL